MDHQDEAIALVLRLMKINRTTDMASNMINQYRQMLPDIPDSFWDEIDPDEFSDLLIPIYTRHLTIEDMRASIEFYESPAGQKLLDKTPAIMEDSMKAGEQWGLELGRKWEEKHALVRQNGK